MAFGEIIWTYANGAWIEGDAPILTAADHGAWQGTMVFDGARAFDGFAPDLDRHCARVVASARALGLEPVKTGEEIAGLAREGIARFPTGMGIYIRPMMWSRSAGPSLILADPASTAFALCLESLPMPDAVGQTFTTTSFRRPTPDCMPVEAKAGCLYPNNARMIREAHARGFQNAVVRDAIGNVAEAATANLFIARDGEVLTPIPSGCFLNGITRQRVISLLRADGVTVREETLTLDDLRTADEMFTTGNALKVMPALRFEERHMQYGPLARRARALYWDFAASEPA